MNYAYSAADFAICRAGAMSITELAYYQIPSIFIPLAAAAENHQYFNADVLVKENAALVIQEKDLTPDILLNKMAILAKNKNIF